MKWLRCDQFSLGSDSEVTDQSYPFLILATQTKQDHGTPWTNCLGRKMMRELPPLLLDEKELRQWITLLNGSECPTF